MLNADGSYNTEIDKIMGENAEIFKHSIKHDPELWKCETLSANRALFQADDLASKLYFVESGMLRIYTYNINPANKHKLSEITLEFFFTGDTIISYASFMVEQPNLVHAETIQKSVVYSINKDDWQIATEKNPELINAMHNIGMCHLYRQSARIAVNACFTAQEHYEKLCEFQDKRVISDIKDKYLASYFVVSYDYFRHIKNKKKHNI